MIVQDLRGDSSLAGFEVLKALVTWLLVIAGWLVVSRQQAMREESKNTYARVEVLRSELKQIEVLAVKFHTSEFDHIRARELSRAISSLAMEVSHIRRENSLPTDLSLHLANFRRAITIDNFDASNFEVMDVNSPLIDNIALARDALDRDMLVAAQKIMRPGTGMISRLLRKYLD